MSGASTRGQFRQELESFRDIWHGGYFEGDPLDPLGPSSYGELGYMSVIHAIYLYCIRPYITPDVMALEIGPGRGAWTKTMLDAREVWCLDAKSREDNGIDIYLGFPKNLVYHQVTDFSCRELPDDTFDFLFSFGALCHISWDGIVEYTENLYSKLRRGATAFVMVADYDKANRLQPALRCYDAVRRVNAAIRLQQLLRIDRFVARRLGRRTPFWESLSPATRLSIERLLGTRILRGPSVASMDKNEDVRPRAGRWYHAGAERTTHLLRDIGYVVVNSDVGLSHRDPMIHFRKP
jgi:hypothetical protein